MRTNNMGHNGINRLIITALAEIRQESYNDLQHGGDLEITAKEQPAVVAILEDNLDCGPLLEPRDLGRDKKMANSCLSPIMGTSVSKLGEVIHRKLAAAQPH